MRKRKTRRKTGGVSNKFYKYANLMKQKHIIDANNFRLFLDSQIDPLKQVFNFNNDNIQYTISEWALICNVGPDIYNILCNYKFDLTRRIKYPFETLYNNKYNNTILEAYVLKSDHIGIISTIISQLLTESSDIIQFNVLYNWYNGGVVPTLLKCMLDINANNTKNIIVSNILSIYSNPSILSLLTKNFDYETTAKIFYYSCANSCLPLIELLLFNLEPTDKVRILFEPDIIGALLIQNNKEVFSFIVNQLNQIDENIIGTAICQVMKIEKHLCTKENIHEILETENATLFFEKLGRYAIDNFAIPSLRNRPSIIVVCHGFSLGPEQKMYNFPLHRLCFYAQKGHMLCDISPYSRPIQELICAGHYDSTLNCTPSDDGKIMTENLIFNFTHNSISNNYLGFYICWNGNIQKINHPTEGGAQYAIDYIINYATQISQLLFSNISDVDLMIFSCIGYSNTNNTTVVNPKL